ncbi:hypothetical protein HWV62_34935 [Athelia sp. TMB]|nr:hypothetical protein HWV62_34935 [Athelia sp. TMB]
MASVMSFGVEPFEESQGITGRDLTTPDALKDFYAKMEQQETLQRKMSRAPTTKKPSIWSRKSSKLKKAAGAPIENTASLGKFISDMASTQQTDGKDGDDDEKIILDDKADQIAVLARSIIPDTLRDLPTWYIKENDANAGHTLSYRLRYPIHCPVGPRCYKNHHLIPPSQLRPAHRPPSVFSPQFPPMASSLHDSHEEVPSLYISPSMSPLATPNSSQPDVATKPRGRKTSQTTPDTVDLLDVTDPWGTTYHHQSPYDPGMGSGSTITPPTTSSVDSQESTSALHLMTAPPEMGHRPRKLSKQRRPILGGLFGSSDKNDASSSPPLHTANSAPALQTESAPVSPLDAPIPHRSSTSPNVLNHAVAPPMMSSPSYSSANHAPPDRKEKRGSVLGRLAKKLSMMKRSPSEFPGRMTASVGSTDEWQHIGAGDAQSGRNSRHSLSVPRPQLAERVSMDSSRKSELTKRVPPPAVEAEVEAPTPEEKPPTPPPRQSADRRSSASLDTPTQNMIRLTIANPDTVDSAEPTPVQASIPLPAESASPARPNTRYSTERPKSTLPPLPPPSEQSTPMPSAPAPLPSSSTAETSTPIFRRTALSDIPQSPATDPMSLYGTYMNGLSGMSAVGVPFPSDEMRPLSAISGSTRATIASSPMSFTSDGPLSRASMIVNPPTPAASTKGMIFAPHDPGPFPKSTFIQDLPSKRRSSPTKESAPVPKAESSRPKADTRVAEAPFRVELRDEPRTQPSSRGESSRARESKSRAEPSAPKVESKSKAEATLPRVETKFKVEVLSARGVELRDEPRSATSPISSRETETFKLIRSPSGNVLANNEATTAAGEHWEVVEQVKQAKASKERSSKSKDREGSKDRERSKDREAKEREAREREAREREAREREREAREREREREARDREAREREARDREARDREAREREVREREAREREARERESRREAKRERAEASAPSLEAPLEQRRSRKKSPNSGSKADQHPVVPASTRRSTDASRSAQDAAKPPRKESSRRDKPQPAPPPPTPAPAPAQPLERRPSAATRPTSELPSTAEMHAMRAREAWEMDRLWKGRSMYYGAQPEPNGALVSPSALPQDARDSRGSAPNDGDLNRDNGSVRSGGHGSSHTSFQVQPLQSQSSKQTNILYSNMPIPTTSFTYAPSTHSAASATYDYSGSFCSSSPPDPIPPISRRPNPLPPPPRESTYQPAPLPPFISSPRPTSSSSDYWTNYPGVVTTTH